MIPVRTAAFYLLLVGIPMLGMSAVLRLGRNLRAPASFGGKWSVSVSPATSCNQDSLAMIIEQSGPVLRITTPEGGRLVGQVTDNEFTAEGPDNRRLHGRRLPGGVARYEGAADGILCDGARNIPFHATRLLPSRELTGP